MTTAITFSRQNDAGTTVESPLTRTTTSTRFDRKFYSRIVKKYTPRIASFYYFTPEKVNTVNFLLKEAKPSPDRKIIKLLTFDDLLPSLRHSRLNSW